MGASGGLDRHARTSMHPSKHVWSKRGVGAPIRCMVEVCNMHAAGAAALLSLQPVRAPWCLGWSCCTCMCMCVHTRTQGRKHTHTYTWTASRLVACCGQARAGVLPVPPTFIACAALNPLLDRLGLLIWAGVESGVGTLCRSRAGRARSRQAGCLARNPTQPNPTQRRRKKD